MPTRLGQKKGMRVIAAGIALFGAMNYPTLCSNIMTSTSSRDSVLAIYLFVSSSVNTIGKNLLQGR